MASKLCLCLTILVAYLCSTFGKTITFKNCGPDNVIQTVDIKPCDNEPCTVKKGDNASVVIDFTSTGTGVTAIKTKAFGVVFGASVPYPVPKPDGCQGCNLTCPLQPGSHTYLNGLIIPTNVPSLRLVVKWELLDQSSQSILCFEFPMVVTD